MNRSIQPSRVGRLPIRGALASAAIVVLVVGVPVALTAAAGGPSAHLDPGALWRAALGHRPGDVRVVTGWLGRAALLMAWIAWAWLTLCVMVEIRAWLSGRSTARLPASRALQWVAAVLVGTAFAVGTAGRAPVHQALAGDFHGSPSPEFDRLHSGLLGPSDSSLIEPSILEFGIESIATAAGSTGGSVGSDALPGDVTAGTFRTSQFPDPAAEPREPSSARYRVAARQTLWSIAEDQLGQARRWKEIAELNYGVVQRDGSRLTGDHWIQPGWELLLPATGRTVASPGAAAIAMVKVEVPEAEVHLRATPAAKHVPLGAHRLPVAPVSPLGAGIVGVGVADLVDRLRRVQQRHRTLGARIRLPEPMLRSFEQRLRVGDGRGELDAVEAAVEAWAGAFDPAAPPWRLTSVRVTATHVRLTLDRPLDAFVPAPFCADGDPATFAIERDLLEPAPAGRRGARLRFPSPTLVTVGRSGDEVLMVNLEGMGSVVLAGDLHANESVGRAMALELATSRWAAAFDLVLIGFGTGMERFDRVAVLADAGPISADLSWRRLSTAMQLEDQDVPRVDRARLLSGVSDWPPVVVVCGPGVPSSNVEAILALAEDGRFGIAVIAISGPGAPSYQGSVVVRPGDEDPTGLSDVDGARVVPQRIDEEEIRHVSSVLGVASLLADQDDGGADRSPATTDTGSVPSVPTRSYVDRGERTTVRVDSPAVSAPGVDGSDTVDLRASGPSARPIPAGSPEVEVAVLGPVEIRGAARGFTRAWAKELVVYLAMHPGGAANETWATALWPERLMAPSSLHSTASVARRSLGTARDGTDHLPRAHGRLALASSVGTDWARFQVLATSDDPEQWCAALSMVRGRPFEDIRATDWSILDGTAPAIESAVVDLSGRLAGARLRAGDPRGAEWSARRGLLVSPYDERLYRMLLRAADAAGNPGGVESVMAELVRVVADEVEPIESVHPSTLDLYRSLSRRPERTLRPALRS